MNMLPCHIQTLSFFSGGEPATTPCPDDLHECAALP